MAPPVRILSLLIFAAALAGAHPKVLLIGAVLLLGTAALSGRHHADVGWRSLGIMLRRVRWLLAAMFILYGWFTPGAPLLPGLGSWSPSTEGLGQGLLRMGALLVIVSTVYLLLSCTTRGALVGGLLWYGGPLRRLGLDDRRLAVRLVLALEAVPQVQELAGAALRSQTEGPRLRRWAGAADRLLRSTLEKAAQDHGPLEIPDTQPVHPVQWLFPAALALLLWAAAQF